MKILRQWVLSEFSYCFFAPFVFFLNHFFTFNKYPTEIKKEKQKQTKNKTKIKTNVVLHLVNQKINKTVSTENQMHI